MTCDCYPLRALLLTISGWVHCEQQRTIGYLVEENHVLEEPMKGRKLRLKDDQRCRRAAQGKQFGRRALNRVATSVTPDTITRWHRILITAEWTHDQRKTGQRGMMRGVRPLIARMARENTTWGSTRIQGAQKDLGHRVGRSTISRAL